MTQKWMKLLWLCLAIGAVVWIMPFGIVWLNQGQLIWGAAAIALTFIGIVAIAIFVPWKYPDTKLWMLLIPPYIMFILAILLLLYVLTKFRNLAEVQYGLWLIPCFIPFLTFGYRTWNSLTTISNENN